MSKQPRGIPTIRPSDQAPRAKEPRVSVLGWLLNIFDRTNRETSIRMPYPGSSLRFNYVILFTLILAFVGLASAVIYPVLMINEDESGKENTVQPAQSCGTIDCRQLMADLLKQTAHFKGKAGIFIKDLKSGETVEINGDALFPSASLVKMPIMAAVFQAISEGSISLNDTLTLRRHHKVAGSGQLWRMRLGTKFTVRNLIERMIQHSDNTATNMLVEALGFGYINQKFTEFGLKNTDLRRGVMDLKWRQVGIENYTTPREMGFLLERIYQRNLVNQEASGQMLQILKDQKVNDRIPRRLTGALAIAHKTGTLSDTSSDCGIVFSQHGDFVICVLTADIQKCRSSMRTAKKFISRVAESTYQYYRKPQATE